MQDLICLFTNLSRTCSLLHTANSIRTVYEFCTVLILLSQCCRNSSLQSIKLKLIGLRLYRSLLSQFFSQRELISYNKSFVTKLYCGYNLFANISFKSRSENSLQKYYFSISCYKLFARSAQLWFCGSKVYKLFGSRMR